MKRRKLLVGIGSLAAGGAAAIGTGAFTSVEASRTIAVEVAGDSSAFLLLDPSLKSSANDVFASYDDGQLVLNFDDTAAGGEGINNNAVTTFDQVFKLKNHGTQSVNIWFEHSLPGVTFYRFNPDSNSLDGPSNAKIGLQEGGHMKIGVEIDTRVEGTDSDFGGTVTVHADVDIPDQSD